jgi:low affinity Fe/Cu permease
MASSNQLLKTGPHGTTPDGTKLSPFARLANGVAHVTGRPATFALCCMVIVGWAVSGPFFRYSDTWQLIINTGTTIITFLMVFLIQNTQNREGVALQAKLDELIRVTKAARNDLVAAEQLPEERVIEIKEEVARAASCLHTSKLER